MNQFIEDLKNSEYFHKYVTNEINPNDIVGIYIAGSAGLGIEDEYSDYDLVVITTKYIPELHCYEESARLKYKGRVVHWYYQPLSYLFSFWDIDTLDVLCKVQFDFFFRNTTIYENPIHTSLILKLDSMRTKISKLACYAFLKFNQIKIRGIVNKNSILKRDYTKLIYHWCVASCYLLDKPLEVSCLREIKRIRHHSVSDEHKQLAIQILKEGINYLDSNSWDCEKELHELYEKIYK